jgi:hypothetical protein
VSDFLDAAVELLAEFGETITLNNRSGTTIGTAYKAFFDPVSGFEDYYPESGSNADDDQLCTAYLSGNVSIESGYTLARTSGTYQALTVASPQDGTTVALRIVKCRKV